MIAIELIRVAMRENRLSPNWWDPKKRSQLLGVCPHHNKIPHPDKKRNNLHVKIINGIVIAECKACGELPNFLELIGMIDSVEPKDVTAMETIIIEPEAIKVESATSTTELPITSITADTRAQSRAEIDSALVAEYAELMRDGVGFPPLTVFRDGDTYWLAEGFHRLEAYRQAGIDACSCVVKNGGLRDAILLSVGSNSAHGKRPTIADKRHAVELLLKDAEWSEWSDREIGKQCGVDHKTVGSVRSSYLGKSPDTPSNSTPETVRKATRNGKEYSINVGGIGKARLYERLSAKDKARYNRCGNAKPKPAEPAPPELVEIETPVNKALPDLDNTTTQAESVEPRNEADEKHLALKGKQSTIHLYLDELLNSTTVGANKKQVQILKKHLDWSLFESKYGHDLSDAICLLRDLLENLPAIIEILEDLDEAELLKSIEVIKEAKGIAG